MRTTLPILFILALTACKDGEVEDTGEPVVITDADGDGHDSLAEGGDDCDDDNALIFPGADEVCDGVDNNCDGVTDGEDSSDATMFYADVDADGYGVDSDTMMGCEAPAGYAASAGDCDDAEANAYPGNVEMCDSIDNNCNDKIDEPSAADAGLWYTDNDGDGFGDINYSTTSCEIPPGYVADFTDCDDTSDKIKPGATEVCDGADNNCDGTVDEDTAVDAAVWFVDADSDGYGSPDATTIACDQPSGYAATSDDCDDGDAATNPGGIEVCGDSVDNDCSGDADGSDATDALTKYVDSDGDGYGDISTETIACSFDSAITYSTDSTDCDDSDPSVNPGADELCDGGAKDENCDGSIDEDSASDALTWYADSDLDGYGDASTTTAACTQPSGYVSDSSDCDDSSSSVSPAESEVCANSQDDDCDGILDECALAGELDAGDAYSVFTAESSYDYLGTSVAIADVDGDGYGEVLVGANYEDSGKTNGGSVFIWSGPVSGSQTASDADMQFYSGSSSARFGEAMTVMPDEDADGYEELVVGAPGHDGGATNAGAVYIIQGVITAGADLSAGGATIITGASSQDNFGATLAWGDLDGDGVDDLAVGAPGTAAGTAYIFSGPLSAASAYTDASYTMEGESTGASMGRAVSMGDANGDGYMDLLSGAPDENGLGAAYLSMGPVTAGDLDYSMAGVEASEDAGWAVSFVGDANADGYDDMLIGAPDGNGNTGTAYLVFGPLSGDISLSVADVTFTGESSGDDAGYRVAHAEDSDGDSYDDLVIGARYNDNAGSNVGAAYLFYGPFTAGTVSLADADSSIVGSNSGASSGASMAAGDVDGDGYDDLLVGANRESNYYRLEGSAMLFLGDQQ